MYLKKFYPLTILLVCFTAACTDASLRKQQIDETNISYKNYLEVADSSSISSENKYLYKIYLAALKNDYSKLTYYAIKANQLASAKKMNEALVYIDSLETLYNNTNKDFQKAFALNFINTLCIKANILFSQNKYQDAYNIYYTVLEWNKKNKHAFSTNYFFLTMGMNAYEQKLFHKAVDFFKAQLQNLATVSSTDTVFNAHYKYYFTQQAYNNIGLSYTKLNNLDSAFSYYTKALQFIQNAKAKGVDNFIPKDDDYNACYAVITGNLAKVYEKKGEYDNAIDAYKKSIQYTLYVPVSTSNFIRDTIDACLSLIQLADIYFKKNDFKNFKLTAQQLNNLIPQNLMGHWLYNNNDYVLGSLKINYRYNKINNNTKRSLMFLENYLKYKDSLALDQQSGTNQNIVEALSIREKESELQQLRFKNQISNIYTGVVVLLSVLIGLVAFLFYRSSRKQKKINNLLANLNNEIKQQQKETAFAFEQVVEANKEKDKILHIVAHDLRNPLSGIASLSDLILEEEDVENSKQMLQGISNASKRAISLVNDLLKTEAQHQVQITTQPILLNKLLEDVVMLFNYRASEKNITIQFKQLYKNVVALVDEVMLERVVANLIHNAIKFSNSHSEITIELGGTINEVFIKVIDSGIGMSETLLQQLFDAHVNIKRTGTNGEKSYGLGWQICKQIIEAHNGSLTATSKENEGTTVIIQLKAYS